MNAGSAVILGLVLALAALAIWRAWRKGAPCECGGNQKVCAGKCCCGGKMRNYSVASCPFSSRVSRLSPSRSPRSSLPSEDNRQKTADKRGLAPRLL